MSQRVAEVTSLVASVLNIPSSAVTAATSMENTPQWDSLAQLNICLALQERYGISMDMETIANSTSVARLLELLPA